MCVGSLRPSTPEAHRWVCCQAGPNIQGRVPNERPPYQVSLTETVRPCQVMTYESIYIGSIDLMVPQGGITVQGYVRLGSILDAGGATLTQPSQWISLFNTTILDSGLATVPWETVFYVPAQTRVAVRPRLSLTASHLPPHPPIQAPVTPQRPGVRACSPRSTSASRCHPTGPRRASTAPISQPILGSRRPCGSLWRPGPSRTLERPARTRCRASAGHLTRCSAAFPVLARATKRLSRGGPCMDRTRWPPP